jgi:putative transposase
MWVTILAKVGFRPMPFELFDAHGELTIREGTLPHWYQPGVTYFVTFRTEDSVPQSLLRAWHTRRDTWLCRHGIDPHAADWKTKLRENAGLEDEYHGTFTREFMNYLDRGHGACPLRNREIAEIVCHNLRHFDGARYHLGDFVVMPNHVHLLCCLIGPTEIERQCRSWKRFTAGRINRSLGRSGRFWQEESFDHLVRSLDQFEHLQRYIAANPHKAGLSTDEYLHYIRPR